MKKVTVNNYKKDKYYSRVKRAVARVLEKSDEVAPVEVLLEMGNLDAQSHKKWRKGQVPYLERVIQGNLSKVNRILRIIGFYMHDLNMAPYQGYYQQWGTGKKRILKFTRFGIQNIEHAYSRHYKWNQSPEKKQQLIARTKLKKVKAKKGESDGGSPDHSDRP